MKQLKEYPWINYSKLDSLGSQYIDLEAEKYRDILSFIKDRATSPLKDKYGAEIHEPQMIDLFCLMAEIPQKYNTLGEDKEVVAETRSAIAEYFNIREEVLVRILKRYLKTV